MSHGDCLLCATGCSYGFEPCKALRPRTCRSAIASALNERVLYLVSQHPEVEKKLLQEIDAFGPHDLIPTSEDLQHKFPYLDEGPRQCLQILATLLVHLYVSYSASPSVGMPSFCLPNGGLD